MQRMTLLSLLVPAAALVALPGLAAAQVAGDTGDVGVRVTNGQIQTTLVGDGDAAFTGPPQRVFAADFGEFETGDDPSIYSTPPQGGGVGSFITNLPGFDSAPGTFTPGVGVGLDVVTGNLLFGDNLVRYDPATNSAVGTPAELQINFGSQLRRTDGSFGSGPLYLAAFNGTGGDEEQNGRWHRHMPFAVYGGLDNTTGDLTAPADGTYILQAELSTLQPGVGTSEPLFIVLGVNTSQDEVASAINFVNSSVPEPSSLALLGVGGLALLRRRRAAR